MTIESVRESQYNNVSTFLKSVELNPIESCTRRCSFCPRSNTEKYPSTHNKISVETCKNVAIQLKNMGFSNRVGFVGFGEPLLHPNLENCIQSIKDYIPDMKWIEINTNGDRLTKERIQSLVKSGCNTITVSMYDSDISSHINELKGDLNVDMVYRHHYDPSKSFNLNIVNRSNVTYGNEILNIESPCYIPFYKLMIDWNGDVLTCQNDWARHLTFGNVNETTLEEIIHGDKIIEFKKSLIGGKRTKLPCSKCNVCGTIRGKQEFDEFKHIYETK